MKTARRSVGEPVPCTKPWPDDCFVQCGGSGIVFTKREDFQKALTDPATATATAVAVLNDDVKSERFYRTAFFEAFPKDPKTFIRGEGQTIEDAEEDCWKRYERILACNGHEYRHHGVDGAGVCKKCNLFSSDALEPLVKCACGGKRYTSYEDEAGKKDEVVYCETCFKATEIGRYAEVSERFFELYERAETPEERRKYLDLSNAYDVGRFDAHHLLPDDEPKTEEVALICLKAYLQSQGVLEQYLTVVEAIKAGANS